jgi:hypothetical protein
VQLQLGFAKGRKRQGVCVLVSLPHSGVCKREDRQLEALFEEYIVTHCAMAGQHHSPDTKVRAEKQIIEVRPSLQSVCRKARDR